MRIGILTPHYAYNYGAVLQAFALLHYLRSRGHEAQIINRRPPSLAAVPSRMGRWARALQEHTQGRNFVKNEAEHLQPQTVKIVVYNDLKLLEKYDFDAVVVGSDQVWRDDYAFNSFGYNMFLDFVDHRKVRKIAYAPSFGKNTWQQSEEVRRKVEELLKEFHAISVREESGVRICADIFGVEATHVLDPTLLLSAKDYMDEYHIGKNSRREPYVVSYILDYDDEKKHTIDTIAAHYGKPHVGIDISNYAGRLSKFVHRFYPTYPEVRTWIENIAHADFVVTNSFHGMVFSIIFCKQFIVYGNRGRGMERFHSLLKIFGLERRLLDWHDNFREATDTAIDYRKVEPVIKEWQQKSYTFINEALT